MARTGNSSLWISRNQSSVLRRAHGTAPRKGFTIVETRVLPLGERLLASSHSRRPKRGYNDGLYPTRRANDGHAIWFCRPRYPHLFDATRADHGAAARRLAEHEIGPAGNLWNFGRHAADRSRDERRPSTGQVGF